MAESATKAEDFVDNHEFLTNILGHVGGGLAGYKLGSNFGGIGKVLGGVIGVWKGDDLADELAHDFAGAIDYAGQGDSLSSKISRFTKAASGNLFNFSGQSYTGNTTEAEVET